MTMLNKLRIARIRSSEEPGARCKCVFDLNRRIQRPPARHLLATFSAHSRGKRSLCNRVIIFLLVSSLRWKMHEFMIRKMQVRCFRISIWREIFAINCSRSWKRSQRFSLGGECGAIYDVRRGPPHNQRRLHQGAHPIGRRRGGRSGVEDAFN